MDRANPKCRQRQWDEVPWQTSSCRSCPRYEELVSQSVLYWRHLHSAFHAAGQSFTNQPHWCSSVADPRRANPAMSPNPVMANSVVNWISGKLVNLMPKGKGRGGEGYPQIGKSASASSAHTGKTISTNRLNTTMTTTMMTIDHGVLT